MVLWFSELLPSDSHLFVDCSSSNYDFAFFFLTCLLQNMRKCRKRLAGTCTSECGDFNVNSCTACALDILMLNLMVHLLSFFWLSFFLLIQPSPETTSGYLPDIWELMQQSQELFQQLILSRAYFYCSPVHFFLLTNAFRKRYPGSKPT